MPKDNFILISNQRCGSTWVITSLGNCENVQTDYEVKWSEELLLGKPSPYHLFLKRCSKLYKLIQCKLYLHCQ